MKKTRALPLANEPVKPGRRMAIANKKEDKFPVQQNLSPDRIMNGASTRTALLNEILAQREEYHQLRDWGINE